MPLVIALLAIVAVIIILAAAWSALLTIAFAFALALLTLPIVNRLERAGVRRSVGALIVVGGILLVLVLLVGLTASVVVSQGPSFVAAVPPMLDTLRSQYEALGMPAWLRTSLDSGIAMLSQAVESADLSHVVLGVVEGVIGFAGVLVGLSIVPFFMYYVLVDEPETSSRFYRGLPAPWRVHVDKVVEIFRRDFADYFRAEFIVGATVGVAIAVGMMIIGTIVGGPLAEFALFLGLVAAVMELLPSIGPVISFVPALLIAATTSPAAVVLVSIYYFATFNIESSFLVPSIEGKIIDFDRASVLVLIAVGFALGGIVGGVLALPIGAIVRDLFAYTFETAEAESAVVANS
jgi:predicted PurR-regulated permease PerM